MQIKYNTYICYSEYHLFIALVNVLIAKDEKFLIFCPSMMSHNISEVLFTNCKFVFYDNRLIEENWIDFKRANPFALNRFKKALETIVGKHLDLEPLDHILTNSTFYVFNDGTPFVLNLLLLYKQQTFILIEEGELIYSKRQLRLNDVIKRIIGFPLPFGRSSQISSVFVRFPQRLPMQLQKKASIYDINSMAYGLPRNDKDTLLYAFGVDLDTVINNSSNNLLLITQPLSEDGIISEQEKKNIYQKIASDYGSDWHVFIKPHPRELTDYTSSITNSSMIKSNFPVELLSFLPIEFDLAITLFSTAIHLVPAKKHITLGLNYNASVDIGWRRLCGVKEKL